MNGGQRNTQDHYNNGKQGKDGSIGGDNTDGTPVRFTESSSVSVSSSVRCNDYTPSLDQPFQYGQQPIRGPYITPSIFNPYTAQNFKDEYSLTKLLGPEKSKTLLQRHYSSWVTEDTFKRIRDLGLNHIRIPIGFWALGNLEPDEPYVPELSLDYLLQGLKWAAKYGLRVMVELHAAPGSQNGWNHSGRGGKIGWLNGTPEGEKNGKRTTSYMKQLLKLLQGPGWSIHAIFMLERETTDKWYKEAFAEMRNVTGQQKGPWGILHDGFLGLTQWEGFMSNSDRLALDVHQYLIFDHNLIRLSRKDQSNFPCWSKNMQRSSLKFGPTLVGEFSSATNDCAIYLNGIGVGYRWDGTFLNEDGVAEEAACQPKKNGHLDGYCSCEVQNHVATYTPEHHQSLSDFTQAQMDAFEQGMGWFYWNFKTETSALWSYFDGVDQG
ncbi:MAG: glycoside hydrolase superfamily [Benniella sp.]|nr:MAG: glycoside hydrolase superfamily [Benniella sp.]